MPIELYISIICSIIAYIYTVLQEENSILFWWWKLLNKHLSKTHPMLFTLFTCPLCMAGQFALWTTLILMARNQHSFYPPDYMFIDNGFISLIFTVSLSILFAKIIARWS